MFSEFFKGQVQDNSELHDKYVKLAYFFTTECSWSQQDFDEAEIEFMNDIVEEAKKQAKKLKKGKK